MSGALPRTRETGHGRACSVDREKAAPAYAGAEVFTRSYGTGRGPASEIPAKALDVSVGDGAGGEAEEGSVDVVASFPADA